MKTILLFLYLIACSYCLKMTQVTRNSRTSLPISTSEKTYFYLTNSNYYSYSNYIYICLEDNNFGFYYNFIKYCLTNTNPGISPDIAVSECSFKYLYYYSSKSSSYFYKIPTTNSSSYSIVYYEYKYSSGSLYVTSDYNDLALTIIMTQVSRNSRTSLPTISSYNKYFYLTNSKYNSYSNYIYFCLEYNNFDLLGTFIKYCSTNNNPGSSPDNAVNGCSFGHISYYTFHQPSSNTIKYYYKFAMDNSYNYSIICYELILMDSSGYLYVTSDYYDFAPNVQMSKVSKSLKRSLSTMNSYNKYFYLTNSEYYPYSSYIYISLEDRGFDLSYNKIKYCFTNTNPSSFPDSAVSGCSFSSTSYYSSKISSPETYFYYRIPPNNSYYYSIVYYEGSESGNYGQFYVISDEIDLANNIRITLAYRYGRISLPTMTSENKYFYLINSDYFEYSSYIYICLEDNGFNLSYNKIKYCYMNTYPRGSIEGGFIDCSFNLLSYYSNKSSSGTYKYYYKISNNNSYYYSVVYYEGRNSSGNLYLTCDYKNLLSEDNPEAISALTIIFIVIGSIIFLIIIIIIISYRCKCYRKKKNDFMPEIQTNYAYPNPLAYPSYEPNNILPQESSDIPLQIVNRPNKIN